MRNSKFVFRNFVKKFLSGYVKFVMKPIDFVFNFRHENSLNIEANLLCQAIETKTEYVQYKVVPKDSTAIPLLEGLDQCKSFAIILQGPLCNSYDMTLNSVKFYKKAYPFAKIIISTWNDEAKTELEKLAELGVVVVLSEKPKNSGFMNVNMQLVNSLAGVKKAKELGCDFAVKTRTDQRVCKPYIFDSMISAIKFFPSSEMQNGRVVALTFPGALFVPYHACDFFYLGYTDDLIKLYSAPLDSRPNDDKLQNLLRTSTRREVSRLMLPPEIYIMKNYCINVLGMSNEDTIENFWYAIKNYFIFYSMKDIDLVWRKYTKFYDLNYYSASYDGKHDSPERLYTVGFDFFNWFNLYMGTIKYREEYEQYADVGRFAFNKK